MKSICMAFALISLFVNTTLTAAEARVHLVTNSEPVATIVLPSEHKHLDFAVQELNEHLQAAAGCTLPVKTENEMVEGNVILLGESKHTKALGIKESDLPSEGFIIKTLPGKLVMVGDTVHDIDGYQQKTEGNLWAVYHILEEVLGIRWYMPGPLGTIIPKSSDVVVSGNVKDAPAFPLRTTQNIRHPKWYPQRAKELKIPEDTSKYILRTREYNAFGGMFVVHTTYHWPRLYHDTHPEYFGINKDGSRQLYSPNDPRWPWNYGKNRWKGWLDYSSEAVLQQYIQNHIDFYEGKNPELLQAWRQHKPTDFYIPVSPADGAKLNYSEGAKKLIQYAGNSYGNYGNCSDYIFQFNKNFAEAMYAKYPDKKVCALAYAKFAIPPKSIEKFPPNFYVYLCMMTGIPYYKEPHVFDLWLEYTRQWHKKTGHKVAFWHYTVWPIMHCPKFFASGFQKWCQATRDIGLGGFINGPCLAGKVEQDVYGLYHLNHYFIKKIYWNPDYDLENGLREYCTLMFGPAQDEMYALWKLIWDRWDGTKWNIRPSERRILPHQLYGEEGTYPPTVIAQIREILAKLTKHKNLSKIEQERVAWIVQDFNFWLQDAGMDKHNPLKQSMVKEKEKEKQ